MSLKRGAYVLALALVASILQLTVPVGAAHAGKFTPRPGVTFNSAIGNQAAQRRVMKKLLRTINSTPRRQQIHIMTWNFQSQGAVDALLRAQKRRNVRVRLLMARGNTKRIDNASFRRLKRGLRRGNAGRRADRRSWARTCSASCRGRGGSAHAKYYLFSKSGRARNVFIQGSANLTAASAHNQWNDIYTTRNRSGMYDFGMRVFKQMARDKPARPRMVSKSGRRDRVVFLPSGRRSDPVMGLLNKVRCRGATNTGNHRTQIRIVPDAMRGRRGMRLGLKVRRLWRDGCGVRLGYTVMGKDVGRMLRTRGGGRSGVPMRHLVQDFDGDGQFDNYFHMKAMTIVGNVGGRRGNFVTLNGSANWSDAAVRSDENLGIYWMRGVTRRYAEHLNYWYKNFPRPNRTSSKTARTAIRTGRMTPDGLLFGTGPIDGVDPYAHVEMD